MKPLKMQYDFYKLNEISTTINLLEYASNKFEFNRNGSSENYYCRCPNHNDDTPSLCINNTDNYFHCFSCGVSGNLLTWLTKVEHLSWNEAITKLQTLSGMQGVQLKQCDALAFFKHIKNVMERKDKIIERPILPHDYLDQFKDELPQEWLDEGISAEAMKLFEIKIDERANRIIYPVYDDNGNLIGAKGRTRFKNYQDLKIAKYMNYKSLANIDFFQGMNVNKKYILSTNKIVIVEGLKSVMKLHDFGLNYSVAAETSCLNDEQIKILIRMGIKDITIAFDKGIDIEKIRKCSHKLKRFANVYAITDKHNLLNDKDAPVDQGKEVWERLFSERIRL